MSTHKESEDLTGKEEYLVIVLGYSFLQFP